MGNWQIVLSNGEIVLVDYIDCLKYCCYNWSLNSSGYPTATVDGETQSLHVLVGRRIGITGELDHKNRNKLDARSENLRPATKQQNQANRAPSRHSKSHLKGVRETRYGTFEAYVTINGQWQQIGTFLTVEAAIKARDDATLARHGEYAYLNSENPL